MGRSKAACATENVSMCSSKRQLFVAWSRTNSKSTHINTYTLPLLAAEILRYTGTACVTGGRSSRNASINTVECYDIHKNQWSSCSPMRAQRYRHGQSRDPPTVDNAVLSDISPEAFLNVPHQASVSLFSCQLHPAMHFTESQCSIACWAWIGEGKENLHMINSSLSALIHMHISHASPYVCHHVTSHCHV